MHDKQPSLVFFIARLILGQKTLSAANKFMLVMPWCAACIIPRHFCRRLGGITRRPFMNTTPCSSTVNSRLVRQNSLATVLANPPSLVTLGCARRFGPVPVRRWRAGSARQVRHFFRLSHAICPKTRSSLFLRAVWTAVHYCLFGGPSADRPVAYGRSLNQIFGPHGENASFLQRIHYRR